MTNPLYDRLFGQHAGRDDIFLHLPGHASLSYDAFLRMAARLAHVLRDCGLKPGDRLAVQAPKTPEALALYAAAVQAGVIFLPLNTAYRPTEVEYFVADSGARLLVCDADAADALSPVAAQCGAQLLTLGAAGEGTLTERASLMPPEFETVDRRETDLAAFLYTSGTTGRSKGAMLTQANLLSNAETLVNHWQFTGKDVLLHALPIFHTHGLFVASNVMLLVGGQMIFLPGFDRDAMIAHLPQATTLMGVPTFYTRLLDDPRFDRDLVAKMRLFISGSAPLLATTHAEFETRTGHRILERYGMTETNMTTSNPYDGDRRAGTVGPALPGVEVKVSHPETGETLPTGEIGMVEVRGSNVFQGYWNMPEKTAAELRGDGFYITGDLGQLSKDGYLTIVGRGKDLIISGGLNIYPKEVESLLDAQPGVLESAVIGAPHPDFGEAVVAVLVAAPGQTPDLDSIRGELDKQMARFKQPKHYVLRDALPRNTMGKVQKAQLRQDLEDIFTA